MVVLRALGLGRAWVRRQTRGARVVGGVERIVDAI